MSVEKEREHDGFMSYLNGNPETRAWFEQQWRIWPERADERYTTSLMFLYGGVRAFRSEHGDDPEIGSDLTCHIARLDSYQQPITIDIHGAEV